LCEHLFVAVTALPDRGFRRRDLRSVAATLRALAADLDADDVAVTEALDVWTTFDTIERLAGCAKTLLARRVEESGSWSAQGDRSPAAQLATVSGTSVPAARRMLETSKRVHDLPETAHAMRTGRLSAPQADLIAATATVAPADEHRLLDLAGRTTLAELREECLRTKARVDPDGTHNRLRRERRLREYTDAEGAWNLIARGTADAGAMFRTALDPVIDELFNHARTTGQREPREAYAFDALIELARRARDGNTQPAGRPQPRFMALIRVDHAALQRGAVEGDEVCEITGLGPIPVRVARDLLGDAVLRLVITKGVDVAHVTHLGRSFTTAQQVALWWQSPTCTRAGCTATARLEIDHRHEWAKTRRTRIDEADRLCTHDHDLKTYSGWALVHGTGRRPMVPPDDPRHPRNKPRPPPDP
jgi:hypothetical protein